MSVLAELVDGENNFDDTLDETNEHFLKVCGKSYKPVKYEFHSFCFCEGYILICSSDNYKTYGVYYGTDNDIKLYGHPQEFYKFDERYVVDIWTELKQLPVKEVYEKIRGQQVVENMNVEKKIRKQLDYIQSVGRIE